MGRSLAEQIAEADEQTREDWLASLSPDEALALLADWTFTRRDEQAPPERDDSTDWWRWWIIVTGRGWGKNRTGAEWVVDRCERFAEAGVPHLIGLLGQNNDDVKALQIGGESGLRAVVKRRGHIWFGPESTLEPRVGIRREDGVVHWSNIEVHTAVEPEGPRGRNFHTLWFDELAAYKHKVDVMGNTVFTNAELALRAACPVGMIPQAVITTTPKPIPLIRSLVAGEHGPTHVTRGSMYDNRAWLDPEFVNAIRRKYEGTRLAGQEIEGEIIMSVEGALWTPDLIHRWRVNSDNVPTLSRIAIGVDPSGSDEGDYCGIVATGLARKRDAMGRQHGFVLDDASVQNRPEVWGATLSELYHSLAERHPNVPIRVAAEVNFGAALVVDVIHLIDSTIPVDEVRASRGKRIRAEPVALLYDTGQWHHVGVLAQLEEEMTFWTPLDPSSPDRMDALVWSACALIPDLTRPPSQYAKGFADRRAA